MQITHSKSHPGQWIRNRLIACIIVATILAVSTLLQDYGAAGASAMMRTRLQSLQFLSMNATANETLLIDLPPGSGEDPTASRSAPGSSSPSLTQQQQQQQLKPLMCGPFLRQVRTDTHPDIPRGDPNRGEKFHVWTNKTHNPFWISLFQRNFDQVRWSIHKNRQYYETALERIWTGILLREANNSGGDAQQGSSSALAASRVIDVGGNIGYYSLLSASLGNFTIDSFEPNLKNNIRFCESLELNGWNEEEKKETQQGAAPSINIYPYGLSVKEGTMSFVEDANPGAGRLVSENATLDHLKQQKDFNPTGPIQTIQVSTLDTFAEQQGWFQTRPNITILKIDAERHESQVLLGASRLLKARLVQNIFTEAALHGNRQEETAAIHLLIDAGYRLEGYGGWPGPGRKSLWPADHDIVERIFDQMLQEKEKNPRNIYLNLWWKLK